MADGRERVNRFLLQDTEMRVPGYPPGPSTIAHSEVKFKYREIHPTPPTPSRTFSAISAGSSIGSSNSYPSDTSSHKSSASTAPSSTSSTPQDYGYDLPCVLDDTGCNIHFPVDQLEDWISHTLSHFGSLPPPPKTICLFCDNQDGIFESQGDAREVWRQRLLHIQAHLQSGRPHHTRRPDFFLLDYIRNIGLLSEGDYADAIQFSERPLCEGLVPNNYETPEMKEQKIRRARSERKHHDLDREKRQMQRKNGKRQG